MNYSLGPLLWGLLAVPPLILLLYFLKLRRTPLEVPSTYLWTKTIEDLHVNSIWQRLRNSLLLLLQLLIAFLLIGACLFPSCEGVELSGERLVFLIDNSASMSAEDIADGHTRLEEAKKQVGNLIDRMKPGAVAMLISFSDEPDVVQSYTNNRSMLRRKLADIQQTGHSTDIGDALVAASGLANPGRTSDRESEVDVQVADALEATIYIYSDGAVKEVPAFTFGEKLTAEYHPIGAPDIPKNLGITAFSISDAVDSNTRVQAYARIQNSDDEDHVVSLSLYLGDELYDAKANITIPKETSAGVQFDLTGVVANMDGPVPVRLEIDDKDVYQLDNTAFSVLNPPRLSSVLVVTDYNQYLELAFSTEWIREFATFEFRPESYLTDEQYEEDSMLGVYDLIIYDRCAPEKMPVCDTMFIGAIPGTGDWKSEESQIPTTILDVNRGHPLMFSVQMSNVDILESFPLTGPDGSASLIDSIGGSVMMIGPRGGFQDLVLGYPLIEIDDDGDPVANTNWSLRLSFPLFIQNVLSQLGGSSLFRASHASSPGTLVKLKTQLPYKTVTVETPDGSTTRLIPGDDNSFVFASTERSGIYTVREPGQSVDHLFPINLFDRRESNLKVRDDLDIGYEEISGSVANYKPARKDIWPWLVAAALVVLIVEWYIYNRRVLI